MRFAAVIPTAGFCISTDQIVGCDKSILRRKTGGLADLLVYEWSLGLPPSARLATKKTSAEWLKYGHILLLIMF